jgi:excisionase family DNA binding protein
MNTLKAKLITSASRTPASIADQVECTPHALNVRDLMVILRVSDQTIYRMIADQTIPFLTVRNSYRFDPKQIAEWLRQRSMSA